MYGSRTSTRINRFGPIVYLVIVLPVISLCLAGCGKRSRELAPLTGKVTFNGKSLRFGSVTIEHEYGQPATSKIRPDGTFALSTRGEGEGAAVGRRRVRIACFEGQDPARQNQSERPGFARKVADSGEVHVFRDQRHCNRRTPWGERTRCLESGGLRVAHQRGHSTFPGGGLRRGKRNVRSPGLEPPPLCQTTRD